MHFRLVLRNLWATSLVLVLLAATARANTVHAWNGPYAVTVDDSSTVFNNGILFNAGAMLAGPVDVTGLRNGTTARTTLSGTVTATFQADTGYAFSGVDLGFGAFDFYSIIGPHGWGYSGTWHVTGGTYTETTNPVEAGMNDMAWSGSGDTGNFSGYDWMEWVGGGGQWLNIMGANGPGPIIQLALVNSFTVSLDYTVWAYDNSHFAVSDFVITPTIVESAVNTVPDGGVSPLLVGGVMLALGGLARRRRVGVAD